MKITKKLLPKTQVELVVELSDEEVQPYVRGVAKKIAQEVEIKGFRRGHVPDDILKQHVSEAAIYEEAVNEIVNNTYPRAVEQENLQVVSAPQIFIEKIAPHNPLIYKAVAALMPTITLGDYQQLFTQKKVTVMDEKKYERTVEDVRQRYAKEKLVNREARTSDKVLIDFNIKVDRVPIEGGQAQKYPLILGAHHFIPGMEEKIVGLKKDEQKIFTITFPANYHQKHLASKPAEAEVKLIEVYERELPELNDAFAKELNFESAQQMQVEIRDNILRQLKEESQREWEAAVVQEIVNKSTIQELPDQMVDEEVAKILHEMEHDVTRQGLKFDDYLTHLKKTKEELAKDLRGSAIKRLQAALVVRELAVNEKIVVEQVEIDAEVNKLLSAYEHVPEMQKQVSSSAFKNHLQNVLIHKKLFERLAASATPPNTK